MTYKLKQLNCCNFGNDLMLNAEKPPYFGLQSKLTKYSPEQFFFSNALF